MDLPKKALLKRPVLSQLKPTDKLKILKDNAGSQTFIQPVLKPTVLSQETYSLKILKDNADCLDENGANLKKHYSQAQNDLNLINRVMTFHELPDSPGSITKEVFDKKVYQVAQHVEVLNQEIEVSRAKVKAKKN